MSSEPLRREVATCHAENPTWSGSRIARELHRSKTDVLTALRELRDEGHVASGSALEASDNQFLSRPIDAFGVQGARWDATSLELPPDLSFSDYGHIGWALGRTRDMTAWALGDWTNFGEARYGEKYAQAIELTGRRKQTLMNYASVARRVPRTLRRADLSWSHHAEVAALEAGEQERWLAAAAANDWSVEELRGMREPNLPIAVDSVPDLEADEQALALDAYRQLKQKHGDRVTPARVIRLIEKRLDREDREREAMRKRAVSLQTEASIRATITLGNGIELRTGDFRLALADLDDDSVDLVLTDPLYANEFVDLFDDLGSVAARVLKPGRLLATYCGSVNTNEVIARLDKHLDFVIMGAVELPGQHTQLHDIGANVGSKPLLFYSAGPIDVRGSFSNFFRLEPPTTDAELWQQCLPTAEKLIGQLSEENELVLDPFLGYATTAFAARNRGRRFIGCDIDQAAIAEAVESLSAEDRSDTGPREQEDS